MGKGWQSGKFIVSHHQRGAVSDGSAFVLVPGRDPAAIPALVAYAEATPDEALANRLREWLAALGHDAPPAPVGLDPRIPGWVATLTDQMSTGEISPEIALLRMAALVRRRSE